MSHTFQFAALDELSFGNGKPRYLKVDISNLGGQTPTYPDERVALERAKAMLLKERGPLSKADLDAISEEVKKHVKPPADDTAFCPLTSLLDEGRFGTYKRIVAALRRNGWIRTRKPSAKRREIHAGDWHRYVSLQAKQAFDALDVDPRMAAAFAAELQQRSKEIRGKKQA
jgi:hypothetical protein